MRTRTFSVLTLTAAAALALTGCTLSGSTTSDQPPAAVSGGAEPSTPDAPTQPSTTPLGGTYTYSDGVAVTVSAPSPFTPSEYAAGVTYPNNITLTFSVVNGGAENLDLLSLPEVTSGGVKGESITDLTNESVALEPIGGNSTVLPGQSFSWTMAYSVADPADLTVILTPTAFGYDDAIFSTAAQ